MNVQYMLCSFLPRVVRLLIPVLAMLLLWWGHIMTIEATLPALQHQAVKMPQLLATFA